MTKRLSFLLPHNFLKTIARSRIREWALRIAAICFAATALPTSAQADGTKALADAPPMMATLGKMGVTSTGAYTYTIPIIVPPGTNNIVPALSLDYSSQNADGTMGIGWTLAGLPTVTRCPRTTAQDNIHGGVNYDVNDRFCMNGQRLILISGTYGADGAQYRTEVETFSEIISHGTAGNGPAWFEVHTKAGQVLQFGNSSSSAIQAVGKTTVRTWAVNQIADTKGNYFSVTYNNDQTNGQAYPTRIDYTGNAGAGLSPYNSVQFSYRTRSDIVPTYQAGSLMQTTVLLTDIKTYTGVTLVSDYQLAYRNATSAATHDELTSVTECDGAGSCLPPTTFGWQGSRDTLTISQVPNSIDHCSGGTTLLSGDFNGDGLTDGLIEATRIVITPLPYCSYGTFFYGTSSGTFTTTRAGSVLMNGLGSYALTGNIAASGLTDYAYITANPITGTQSWTAYINTGTSFTSHAGPGSGIVPGLLVDLDGDGRADALYMAADSPPEVGAAYKSNGNGTFTLLTLPSGAGGAGFLAAADFDGDGCADYATYTSGPLTIYYDCNPAVASSSTSGITYSLQNQYEPGWVLAGDFNGDGKTDLIDTSGRLWLSTGTGFVQTSFVAPSAWGFPATYNNPLIYTGDFNGDGKSDIAVYEYNNGALQLLIYLSTGTGFNLAATITPPSSGAPSIADWNNDGAQDIWIAGGNNDQEILFSYAPELMTSVTDGLGATESVTYNRLNANGTFYTKGTGATYPTQDMDGPQYVVAQTSASNGIGGYYNTSYTYAGAKQDLAGRGFLGFSTIVSTDQTGLVTTTNYRTDFPYTGRVASQTALCPATSCNVGGNTVTLKSTTNTYTATTLGTSGAYYYFVSLQQGVATANDLDGTVMPTVTSSYTYDTYGNALIVTMATTGVNKVTTNTYNNDTTNWFLGRLLTTSTSSTVNGNNLTRSKSFAYDAGSGLLTQDVIEPNTPSLKLTTVYAYDSFGNKHTVTASGQGITTRTTTANYDALGQFATSTLNALNQSEAWAYSTAFGIPASHTDSNNLTTTWGYDTFGRKTLETRADGNKTAIAYFYCAGVNGGTASCPTYGVYAARVTPENSSGAQNGPMTWTYYDTLARVIDVDVSGFDGPNTVCTIAAPCWIRNATQYDALGRVSQASRPYFIAGGTAKWTVNTYDALARVKQTTFPDSSHTTFAFHGLVTSATNALSQTITTTKDALGEIVSVKDAALHTTTYTYDPFGNLLTTTDPSGNVISNTYDTRGRKTATTDPDMGHWTYAYDVLDELTSQTDAKSQTSTLTYDLLGRLTQRVEPGLTSNWVYDTAANGIGKLASATTSAGYSRTHTYDSLSREIQVQMTIGGNLYSVLTTYNSDGHINTITYPSLFVAQYVYSPTGYQYQLKDGFSGQVYWSVFTRDAELHTLTQFSGNGITTSQGFDANTGLETSVQAGASNSIANFTYTYDTVGNLTQRTDGNESLTEKFCFDVLNRLTNSANNGASCTSGTVTKTIAYDALGDITSKTGIGTYSYPAPGQSLPHAVSSIAGTLNTSYTYDLNGNMTGGNGRTVGYTSFNLTGSIAQGVTTLTYAYDSEHKRISQAAPEGTTVYVTDAASGITVERFIGPTSQWNDYMYADGRIVATHFALDSGTTYLRYFIADHLGSTAILTDETGAVAERDSYDAWGLRRNPNGTDGTGLMSQTTRGFTGQEHINDVGLINYNARVYDPAIGRFMGPDSMIPDAYNAQSLDRYTYVDNRPLDATDPTGNLAEENQAASPPPPPPPSDDASGGEQVTVSVDPHAVGSGTSSNGGTPQTTAPGSALTATCSAGPACSGGLIGGTAASVGGTNTIGGFDAAVSQMVAGLKSQTEEAAKKQDQASGEGKTKNSQEAQRSTEDYMHSIPDGYDGGYENIAAKKEAISARDKAYLDKYYIPVMTDAANYNVDEALVLGVGIESGFASTGTYKRTGDAFGMTGGSTKHMETFDNPQQNVDAWFRQWGSQIQGDGSNVAAFVNGLEGRDAAGNPVRGWKTYNSVNSSYGQLLTSGIEQMQRDIPIFAPTTGPI